MTDLGAHTVGRVEPLTGSNYHIWQLKVSSILRTRKLFRSVIEGPEPAESNAAGSPAAKLRETWEGQNDEAFGIIILTLSPEQAALFIGETKAKKVWDELKRIHAGNAEDRRIDTELELKNIKMGDAETVSAYVTRARSLATQCAVLGRALPERELVYYVVRGINAKLEGIASVLRPNRSLTLEDVQQALQEEEGRQISRQARGREEAYRATGCGRSGQRGADTRKCFVCLKPGHLAKHCWHKKDSGKTAGAKVQFQEYANSKYTTRQGFAKKGGKEHANIASEPEQPNVKHQVFHASALTDDMQERDSESWGLDSGCSAHMTPNIEQMTNIKPVQIAVNLAETDRSVMAEARGNVHVKTTTKRGDVHHVLIEDVLYVPRLRSNLLSVKCLTNKGNTVVFADKEAQIYSVDEDLIAEAALSDNMYIMNSVREAPEKESSHCMNLRAPDTDTRDTGQGTPSRKELWHRRLCHVNNAHMEFLKRENMVRGLAFGSGSLEVCDSCVRGKMAQTPFTQYEGEGVGRPLELVYMDLCGPIKQPSMSNARYIFTLVDAYSRRIFVYFLQTKDEAFERFVEFQKLRENELNSRLLTIRTDNGTEFVNERFAKHVKECGIKHQKTVPYTPQNNSVAERANRTIIEGARTLLIDSGLPLQFWAEAVATVVHVKNCLPTQNRGNKTPMELWSGQKPTVKYFKVFGCCAYFHVPKAKRQHKLDANAKRGIFLGYSQTRKAYRIYDPETKGVCESRSVRFDENKRGAEFLSTVSAVPEQLEYPLPFFHREAEQDRITCDDHEVARGENEENRASDDLETPRRSRGRKRGDTQAVIQMRHEMNIRNREEQLRNLGVRRSNRLEERRNFDASYATESISEPDPTTYAEAVNARDSDKWHDAMEEELDALRRHQVWKFVPRETGMKILKNKWVYKIKKNIDGTNHKYKARLVACGYNQHQGIDFEESFSPVMKHESVRLLVALAAHLKLKLQKYDVKSAYLHGDLKEEVFMEQPKGFTEKGKEDHVCLLKRGLYGLPQSGKCWNDRLHEVLQKQGFRRLESEPCLYIWRKGKDLVILGVYVDDLLLLGTNSCVVDRLIAKIRTCIDIEENVTGNEFLGLEVRETNVGYELAQTAYIDKILARFGLSDCNPVKTPGDAHQDLDKHQESPEVDKQNYLEMLGCLMYLSTCTRPDISFNVCQLSQYSRDPKMIHLTALKRVYRYLKGTREMALTFDQRKGNLSASADASWSNSADAKSFSGYTVKIGNSLISWKSTKQKLVALSTCEAEIIAMCEAVRELKWMTSVLSELQLHEYLHLPLVCRTDSQAGHNWVKNCNVTSRSKHINRKFYFIHDEVRKGNIELHLVSTNEMEADFLTKSLPKDKLNNCVTNLGLK